MVPADDWEYVEKRDTKRGKLASSFDVGIGIALFLGCFIFAWKATWGGYFSGLPLAVVIFVFLFKRKPLKYTLTILLENLMELTLKENRKFVAFIIVWQLVRQVFNLYVPPLGGGSPRSLILFSIMFTIFFFPADFKIIYKKGSIVKWISSRKFYLLACFVVVLGLVFVDETILNYTVSAFQKHEQCEALLVENEGTKNFPEKGTKGLFIELIQEVVDFASSLGEVPRILPGIIVLFISTQLFVSNRYRGLKDMFYMSVKGLVYGGVISAIMKISFHRYRPIGFRNAFIWMGPRLGVVDHTKFSKLDCSFPCGHSTVATAVAFILAHKIVEFLNKSRPNASPWLLRLLVAIIYFFPATIVLARVVDCVHWPSDAIFGAILGVQVGKLILWLSEQHLLSKSVEEKAKTT